jgi:uncharacterized membrane protein
MILGFLGLVTASLFAGAAFYVNFAEQPARLALNERPALIQWQRSYERAALMQASLAMLGFVLGLAAWWWEGRDPRWLAGALVLLAPWPYTLLVIKPVNDKLKAADPIGAGAQTRALIERWGHLHAGRTALGVLATAIFLCAAMAR